MSMDDTSVPKPQEAAAVATASSGRDVFVGRQPIYDRNLGLHAYELLFRRGDVNEARFVDGDEATFQVMLNALVEIGLARLVGPHRAYINVTRNSVLCEFPQFFPKDQVVLEVLEDVVVDAEFMAMIRNFAGQGYVIALDDFVERPDVAPLLEVASIIKLDVRALGLEKLKEQAERYRKYQLLAEKVETHEEFEACKAMGFELFQGYFLCKPKIVAVRHVPTSQLATLRLLARIHDPEVTPQAVAEAISQDVALTYRLIRTVNSAQFGLPVKIGSVAHAVNMLGLKKIGTWVTLLSISGVDDSPPEVMVTAMVRARMCELLARAMGHPAPDQVFLVGLFSVLEGLMGASMSDLLENLPLSDEIAGALVRGDGPSAPILACALAYECGEWDDVALPGLDDTTIREAYLAAVVWADEARATMGF